GGIRWGGAPPPVVEAGRATAVLPRGGEPIAVLEYDAALNRHPSVIETGLAAAAVEIEARRQADIARRREAELRGLARDLLEAEDAARAALEGDLHDGAHQALVGLSLHAALAAPA